MPQDELIKELTFPDYQVLCDEQVDMLEAFLGSEEGYCRVFGLSNSFGDTAEAVSYSCFQAMNECLQMGGDQFETFIKEKRDECAVSPRQGVLQRFDNCGEPVGSLSACSEDTTNLTLARMDYTCDEWTPELRQAPAGGDAPSCKQLTTDCQAVAAPIPNAEFLGSCRQSVADGACFEVSCTDCPAGLSSDLKSAICAADDMSGSSVQGTSSEMGCTDTATAVGSCRQDAELEVVDGMVSTVHITTFIWPTDPAAGDFQTACAEAGGTFSAP